MTKRKKYNAIVRDNVLPSQLLCNIELEREHLDDCYICLDTITRENPAVFIHLCKHNICMDCLKLVSSTNTRTMLENTSRCGICRAHSNKFVMRATDFCVKQHNSKQCIYIPSTILLETVYSHPHCDIMQNMIIRGYVEDNA